MDGLESGVLGGTKSTEASTQDSKILESSNACGDKQEKPSGINIGTLNIVDGRGNKLELACKTLRRLGLDIVVLTETKLNGYHTVSSYGFSIVATKTTR